MSQQPASDTKRFFVGVSGEQQGPFSEEEIWAKLSAGEINEGTPLWYEGLPDWQTVGAVAPFNDKPGQTAKPAAARVRATITPRPRKEGDELAPTFADGSDTSPVFNRKEATFSRRDFVQAYGKYLLILGIVLLFSGALYYIFVAGGDLLEQVQLATTPKKFPAPPDSRETKVSRALSELLLNPSVSLETLKAAVKENSTDEVGKKALEGLLDYYNSRAPQEAGQLLLEHGRPEEAVKYFLVEPPNYAEAARAYSKAAEIAKEPSKQKQFYLEEIRLLLGPANNREVALAKLQEFSKRFPNEPHPYQYYLKTTEQKIQDLFARISFHFVQSLLSLLDTEFKQTKLASRPRVEIRKEPSGKYRLVGSYLGDVVLVRDKLSNIKFQFWLVREQWVLVETNLTEERQKSASLTKQKHLNDVMSANEMLQYLETVFKTQFPKSGLHEKPVAVATPKPE